jgi:disulfide bond formation protein DsbB
VHRGAVLPVEAAPARARIGPVRSVDVVSRFAAILAIVCAAGTLAAAALLVIRRIRPASRLADVAGEVGGLALWLGWVVAAVTTAGSLYYSEVAHFIPCELCWYQRICVYPLSVILLVAAVRKDTAIWRYVAPQVLVGIAIATYHTQLQAFPDQHTFCSTLIPCTTRYVWEFGFVSLPLMDLVALCFVGLMLVAAVSTRPAQPTGAT